MCCEAFGACERELTPPSTLQYPWAPVTTAEPFHQVKQVSRSVPAKPQGKRAWPKCQLINGRVYLRKKQGTRLLAAALSTLCCTTLTELGERIRMLTRSGKGWLFATSAGQQQSGAICSHGKGGFDGSWDSDGRLGQLPAKTFGVPSGLTSQPHRMLTLNTELQHRHQAPRT